MSPPRSSFSSSTTTPPIITISDSNSTSTHPSESSISIITCSPIVADSSSPSTKSYTCEQIRRLLKQQPSTYCIMKNERTTFSSCWEVFGFPGVKVPSTGEIERIDGFTSCRVCYRTFTFTSTTGTRNMISHSCVKNLSNTKITTYTANASSSTQIKLDSMMNNYRQVKLNEKELNIVKDLACSWICHDMRSFSIIEDDGLKKLLQQFVILGKLLLFSRCIVFNTVFYFYIYHPGSKYEEFDVKNALRSADTLSNHIILLCKIYCDSIYEIKV